MNAKEIVVWVLGSSLAIAILAAAMQFWISINVAGQLEAAGIVPVATVTAISTRVENLEELHLADTEDIDKDLLRIETKAERIAQILMED